MTCPLADSKPLLSVPLVHRRHLLRQLLLPVRSEDPRMARFSHIENIDSTELADSVALRAFFDKVVEQKAEGLMVKLLNAGSTTAIVTVEDEDDLGDLKSDEPQEKSRKKALPATYEPDQRSAGWLKVKKDYLEGLGDSLDLVPIGAWWGNGRKAGWWSPILLAARNPESGALEAVCKCACHGREVGELKLMRHRHVWVHRCVLQKPHRPVSSRGVRAYINGSAARLC